MDFVRPSELALHGNVAENWRRFKQRLMLYLEATEKATKPDKLKVAILLNFIGEEALEVFNTFHLKEDEAENFDLVINKFDDFCEPKKNVIFERFKFFSATQKDGESIDSFITELKGLSTSCEFESQKDSLIRDRIVYGIQDKALQERLLREPNLTILKAIEMCKTDEISKQQIKIMQNNQNICQIRKYEKKHSPKQNQESEKEFKCQRCGKSHRAKNCPAWGKRCSKCKKMNHFVAFCKSSAIRSLNDETEETVWSIHEAKVVHTLEWKKSIIVNGKEICFKLDSGAEVNVLPYTFTRQMKGLEIFQTNRKLTSYTGHEIKIKGIATLNCKTKNKTESLEFFIADGYYQPILGIEAIEKLSLIKKCDAVQTEQNNSAKEILNRHKNIFEGIGRLPIEHKIRLKENATPVIAPSRKIPFSIREKVKAELERMEKLDIIEKVEEPSEWTHPIVVVQKPSGDVRICMDPRELNKYVQRERYILPTAETIFSELKGATVFSVFDASSAFWQVPLDKESTNLCTIATPFGRFRFKRLPYGLNSASEVFQRCINNILSGLQGTACYMDDILIYGSTMEEHNRNLETVLRRLEENNVKLNAKKQQIAVDKVNFLGHIISRDGIAIQASRAEAIQKLKRPENKTEVQRFLGMVTYLGKFIPNLSDKTAPLRKLISNKSEWKLGGEEIDCFKKLKDMVSNAPILTFFDPTKPITISSDASQYGIGTVLMQGGHAIEYASFSLNATQRKYAQIEKELLAIVFGCERFQYYIWGNDVIVETDHKPLLSIVKKPLEKLSPRLQRMVLRLMRFQISLKFTPGKNMFVADHLSRDPLKDEVDTSYLEGQTESVHMLLVTTDEKIKRLQKETHGDHTLIQLIEYAKNGWPKYKTKVCDKAKPYWQFQDEIHVSDRIVYKGNCIMVPSTLRKEILQVVHSSHQGIAASKEKARSAFYWPGMITQVENEVEKCRTCQEYSRKNPEESRIAHEIPEFPWEKIAVDFMEVSGTSSILVVDYHSKFVEIRKLSSKRETETIMQLKTIFRTHGIPRTLVSDNGPPFNSTGFKNFAQKYEFKHQTSSPKYPRSNGQVERTIQTIKGLIIKAVKSGRDPNLALMEFNNTPKYDLPSPTQMLMGRSVRTLSTYTRQQLKSLFDTTKNYQKLRDHQQKYAGSPKRILRPLEVGDNIMLQERHRKWVPATVTAKHETPRSYMVKTPSESEYRRNRSHLRPRKFSVEDSVPTSQSPSIPGSQAGTAMDDNIQDHGRPTSENRRAYDPREDIAKKGEESSTSPSVRTRSGRTWTLECQKAFEDLKSSLTASPVLHIFKEDLPCFLYCDAGTLGISGILKQKDENGEEHPVQYFSRSLRKYEQNYSISELECLAIIESIEYFRVYLLGRHFTIYSDHQALVYLKNIKNPSGRLFRWSLRLSPYTFDIHYLKGKNKLEADLLSRQPFCGFLEAQQLEEHQHRVPEKYQSLINTDGLAIITKKGVPRVVVPDTLRNMLLQKAHEWYNHPGITQLTRLITSQYYWDGMTKDINNSVRKCKICQIVKPPKGPTYGEMGTLPLAKEPYELMSMDTVAGFNKYGGNRAYLHVICDHMSRYCWTFPSKSTSILTYIQILKRVFQEGIPKNLLTDRAPAFTSAQFRRFLISQGIKPLYTTANHPQSNGLSERLNATITGKLKILHLEHPKQTWTKQIERVTRIYNLTPHTVTGFPPIYLLKGIVPNNLNNHVQTFPELSEARRIALQKTQARHKAEKLMYDQKHKKIDFVPGDLVLVKVYRHPNTPKLEPNYTGPYEILEILSPQVVRINRPNRPLQLQTEIINIEKLRRYVENIPHITPPTDLSDSPPRQNYFLFPYRHFTTDILGDPGSSRPRKWFQPFNHLDNSIFTDEKFYKPDFPITSKPTFSSIVKPTKSSTLVLDPKINPFDNMVETKVRKCDLSKLAYELGEVVPPESRIVDLKHLILNSQSYEEEFAKQLLETLIEDRERIEERERIEDRKRIEDRERIERERKEQMVMEFELEKLRIQTTRGNNDTSRSTSYDAHYEIRKLMPKYESKDNDLSFNLILFERQAKRLGLDEDQWAFSLLGLLPYEMTQLIARETEEQSGDYRFVKRLLLKRYKLSPEQFRQKFEKHERSQKGSWRDFAFELRGYFNEWIEGMKVENFDALKDLSVTNQLKKKVPNVLRNHLIDDWTKLNNPDELADKLDEYENVRTEMGPPHWNAKHLIPPSFQQKSARFPNQSEFKETKQGTNVSGQDAARNEISETYPNTLRRMVNRTIRNDKGEPKCFNCNQFGHIARDCPAPRTTLTCRGCGQTGHKERNCTRPKEGLKVANLEVEGLETVPPDVYLKDVKIDNKETVKAMIDTGSSSCLMRESVARRISVDIEPDSTSLYGIGNQTAPAARTVGKTTVDLEIDGIVGREITVFIVNDDAQPYDLLIGRTWTDLPYVSFARIGKNLHIGYSSEFPFTNLQEVIKSRRIELRATETVQLESDSINFTSAITDEVKDGYVLFTGVDDACVDSLLEVVDGETTVPIISAGKGKLRVRKNQCVGRVELLNLDDIVVNLDVAEDSFQTKNEEKREGQDQMKRKRPILPEDINVNHSLTSKERQEILDVVNEYRDCFALGMEELGCTDVTKMDIKEVDGSKPVCLRPYKTTASEREAIREIVREWKDNGIVTETRSPYASPVLLVRKKTGDHRLVVDYRRLNIQTVKDKFPLPRIDDLLEGLRNAKFFTTLDLAHGYLQIPLTDKAKLKTAFITPDDTGQFERMIFGLANAPAEFQRLMHTVLGPLLNKKAFCYLDDVVIPAKDWREMIERLREVLERIRSAKLTLKPSKCEFGRREVEFLGYVISTGGLKPGPRKIKAIEEFPEPKNVHDIRRFLGLTNFFRRFVKDFARKAEPLSRLAKKGSQFEWKEEQRRSFAGLRKDLVEYLVLAHYNPELKTEVHCDASAEGLAGMVLQMDEDGKWRLVYCVSKKTTEAEKMYHSSKLELMAIVWTLDRLRQFLVGIKFTVVTDCQALVYMNAKKTTNPQIARWYNLIQEYDFEIRHKPGEKMAHVDGMSRAPVDDPRDTMEEIVEKNLEVCFAITLEEQILMIQHSDPELRDPIQIFRKDPCDRTVGEQNRINDYSYKGGRLFRMVKNGEEERALYVIPKSMRKSLVVKFHDLMGHFATDRTVNKIKELYWFPSMKRYVRRHVAMCLECLFNKVPSGKQQGFLHPIKSGKRPFSIVHMDHVGPFVRSTKGNQELLVIVDNLTRFVRLSPVRNTSTQNVLKVIKSFVNDFGLPDKIISDRGSCFTSRQFEEFCRGNGIHHTLNSTKHPQGNGMVERVNRTVLSTIATSIEDPRRKDWDLKIKEVERDLNNAVNKTTNKTPFETLHGYSPRFHDGILRLADEDVDPWTEPDRIQDSVRTQIENKQEIMKTYYNKKKCRTIQFEVGEIVVMRHVPKMTGEPTKAQPKYRGPLIITEVLPSDTYRVTQLSERTSGRFCTTTAHISQLKSWHSEEDDSATEESPDEEPEVEDTPRRNPRRSCNARFNRGRLKSRNGR
ncbi:hypothetical protein LAZ67_20002148, partial [Cordylochernes scorpioides]